MNQSRIPTRFARETEIDTVPLAGRYTLLDQSGAADLLPACLERGVSVIIGGVFNSGVLADPRPDARYDYVPASAPILERVRRLAAVCARHGVSLEAAAVQFPLGHPAVVGVLAGVRSVAERDENLAGLACQIAPSLWESLAADGLLDGDHVPGRPA
jgi:D-threo-aldose 1-dehydrogenase